MSKQGTRYLTTRQVAAMLGVTAPTVIKWVEGGRISAHRTPGGHRRIAEAEVVRFADIGGIEISVTGTEPGVAEGATKVLIVDRERDFAEMIGDYLDMKGNFTVGHATSAMEAGYQAGQCPPDVILYDVDAISVDIHELRDLNPTARLIVLTSIWSTDLDTLRRDIGAVALLEKPIKLDELLAIIGGV